MSEEDAKNNVSFGIDDTNTAWELADDGDSYSSEHMDCENPSQCERPPAPYMQQSKIVQTMDKIEQIKKEGGCFTKFAFGFSDFLFGMAYVFYFAAMCIGNYGCMLVNLSFFATSLPMFSPRFTTV